MSSVDNEDSYASLRKYFQGATKDATPPVVLTFDEVATLLGGDLPQTAYTSKAWWTGARQKHVAVWRSTGWRVDAVGFRMRRVAFVRI